MVKLTYRYKDLDWQFAIPTDYNEITIEQLIKTMNYLEGDQSELKILSDLTQIPLEHLVQFDEELIIDIDRYVALIWQSKTNEIRADVIIHSYHTYKHYVTYSEMIIGQFEDFKKFAAEKNIYEIIPYVMAFLTYDEKDYNYKERLELIPEILKLPASVGLYHQNLFIQKWDELQKRFVYLFEPQEVEDALIQAGYEGLSKFGFYSNADTLAEGDLFKIKKVMTELTVNEVYTHLTYLKAKNQVQQNYQKIKLNDLRGRTQAD